MPAGRTGLYGVMDSHADTELRRKKAFELRVAGLSYKDIFEEMKKDKSLSLPGTFSLQVVQQDIFRELEEIKVQIKDYAFEVMEIDLVRLENLLMIYYNKALSGDEKSANLALRIMERRSRMLGLDTPRKLEVHDWRSEVIELYKSGKLTRDQIEKELGNELTGKLFESGGVEFTESREAETSRDEDSIIEGKLAG